MTRSYRGSNPARRLWIFLASVVCAAGVWGYAQRVLIPYQVTEAAAHGTPRGNLSDLYPRWLGARELLLHGRDPYSAEVTSEIQAGFYSRPLGADRPGGRNYQQGFYYPVYVAFGLAPTLRLPFESVRRGFMWLLVGLTLVAIPLWLRVVRCPAPWWQQLALIAFTIGSLPVMQGLKLQQITLFVVPLLAASLWLLTLDRQVAAGIVLAVSTIKPQLVWLLLVWLVIWTLGNWRRRYRWAVSFACCMVILFVASEWYLPHWFSHFLQAAHEYRSYTGEMSALDELLGAPSMDAPWSRLLEIIALAGMTAICWKATKQAANTSAFAFTVALVLATTNLIVPSYGPYNQVLLIPALLIMIRERQAIWRSSRATRGLSIIVVVLLGWPFLSGIFLAALSLILPLAIVGRAWAVPFWTALLIPVGVAALMLLLGWQRTFGAAVEASTS